MQQSNDKIAALIGSRICHDLINPVGAVANGLELLGLAGTQAGPEFALACDSATDATARIRLFRLAFGDAQSAEAVTGADVADILAGVYGNGRITVGWQAPGEQSRAEVKAVLLALMCVEHALSGAGRITVVRLNGQWRVRGAGPRLDPDPALWTLLTGADASPDRITPAAVQFALLPRTLFENGWNCAVHLSDEQVEISF